MPNVMELRNDDESLSDKENVDTSGSADEEYQREIRELEATLNAIDSYLNEFEKKHDELKNMMQDFIDNCRKQTQSGDDSAAATEN